MGNTGDEGQNAMGRQTWTRRWFGMIGLLAVVGCGTRGTDRPAQPFRDVTIRLGIADSNAPAGSPATATSLLLPLAAQRGEWEVAQKAHVAVVSDPATAATADVLAFRADRLGDLMDAGALFALPDTAVLPTASPTPSTARPASPPAEDPLAFADILPAFRDQIGRYGPNLMALPLGGSALVLVYHRDLFERPELRRAAEEAGLKLEPPATYTQLDALARFFQGRAWGENGQPGAGIALALGADDDGVADALFLARAASLGLHPDQFGYLFDEETMEPWIDRPAFVAALEALQALRACGPEGMASFDAGAGAKLSARARPRF